MKGRGVLTPGDGFGGAPMRNTFTWTWDRLLDEVLPAYYFNCQRLSQFRLGYIPGLYWSIVLLVYTSYTYNKGNCETQMLDLRELHRVLNTIHKAQRNKKSHRINYLS